MTLWARPSCVSAKLAVIVFIHLQCHWRVLFLGRRFFLRGCGRRSLKVQLNDARSVSEECNVDSICITFHCRCVSFLSFAFDIHWTGNHLGDTNCSVESCESMMRVETYWRECVGEGSCQYCATQIWIINLLHSWMTGQCRLIGYEWRS